MSALAVEVNLERWRVGGAERVGKHCPIVWDVEWSNTKTMKIKYTAGLIGRQSVD